MAARNIRIALGMLLSEADMRELKVDINVINDIRFKMWDLLFPVLQRSPLFGNSPDIGWTYTDADLDVERDLVVYFVRNPSQSVIKNVRGALLNESKDTGGRTSLPTGSDQRGTISEVYVQGNFPAERLAVAAFHELMHNKLQVGNSMHDEPGIGIGGIPSSECTIQTDTDIRRMAAALPARVRQFADHLPGDLPARFVSPPDKYAPKRFCA